MKQALIAIVVIAVLGIGGFALFGRNKDTSNDNSSNTNASASVTPTTSSSSSASQSDASSSPLPSEKPEQSGSAGTADTQTASLTFTSSGFSQSTVTVKSGSKVTITNNSSKDVQPSSDPHPEHTDNPELNFGTIAAGQSKTVTVTKTGTWGIHDHKDASKKATIIVQ